MAISLVGTAGATADSVTLPAHQAGDLIVIYAHRAGALGAPTLPAGWTDGTSNSANGCAARMGFLIASDGATVSGNWTNATFTFAWVFRGQHKNTPVGQRGVFSANNNTLAFWTLNPTIRDGTSWIAGGWGHETATDVEIPVSGMTFRQAQGAGPEAAIFDTNGGVTGWTDQFRNVNASGGHQAIWFEILADIPWIRSGQPEPGLPWRTPLAQRFDLRRHREFARRRWTSGEGSGALSAIGSAALFPAVADTVDDLTATGIATGAPVVGSPAVGQRHALAAAALAAGAPVTGTPAVGQRHALTATALATGAPVTGTPTLASGSNTDALTAQNLATGAPVVGTPALSQIHALAAAALAASAPVTGTPAIGQVHGLTATGIVTGAPVVGTPAVGQRHAVAAVALATGAPITGTPALSSGAGVVNLLALGIATGAPVISLAFLNYQPPAARTVAAPGGLRRVLPERGVSTVDVPASGRAVIAPAEPRVTGPASYSRAARVP